jgi:hypothetical protein
LFPELSRRRREGREIADILRGSWRSDPPLLDPSTRLDALVPLLLRTGGAGLAWSRARHGGWRGSAAAERLHEAYRQLAIHAAFREQQLAAAFRRLTRAGVEAVLGKGWAAARLYPGPGLRPYGDIDLYARPEDHAAVRAALDQPGEDPLPVDLHSGFAELDDRPPKDLLARSRTVRLGEVDVRVFGPEDHLRLLALHLLRHGAWRPVWFCDLAVILETHPPDFDWDGFMSGDGARTDAAVCALRLAGELLGASLDGVPAAVRERRLPRWLVPAILRQWGDARFEPHGTRTPMASELRRPRGLLRALRVRWPNAVEATVGRRARFNRLPRLPFQIGECLARTLRFASSPRGLAAPPER